MQAKDIKKKSPFSAKLAKVIDPIAKTFLCTHFKYCCSTENNTEMINYKKKVPRTFKYLRNALLFIDTHLTKCLVFTRRSVLIALHQTN